MASKKHMAEQPSTEEQLARYNARTPEEQEERRLARRARRGLAKIARTERKAACSAKKAETANAPIRIPDFNQTDRFVCIDLEQFEWSHKHLTEVGITLYDVNTNQIKTAHIIVDENYKKRNGKFVPDNKDNFSFGESRVMDLKTVKLLLQDILDRHQHIVGHAIHGDLKYISKTFGIHTKDHITYDTIKLHKAYENSKQKRNLSKCCDQVGIELKAPHNAGNDSHCNMHLFAEHRRELSSRAA